MSKYQPVRFQLNDEQCEAVDSIDFQGIVFGAGEATIGALDDEPRRFLLLEFSGPDLPAALVILSEDYAGFAWTADNYCRAVVMLSRDANPDECLTHCKGVQKVVGRYLDVTFNETNLLPTPTKDTVIHILDGKPIATSGMLRSVSAYDIKNIDRRALTAFVDKLKDPDLWTLQRGYFPLGAVQTERGHDEALARILHRHGAKPEWIAELVSGNNQHGLEARHGDIQYLNEVIRDTCTNDDVDTANTDSPLCESMSSFMADRKPQQVLVDGILYKGDHNAAMGHPNGGKTAGMLDVGLHVALGRKFGKHDVARDRVIYIAGEDPDGIRRRVKLWCLMHSVVAEALDDWFFIIKRPVLDNPIDVARLKTEMETIRPGLMITDTFSANYGGESEDKATDVKKWMKMIREDFVVVFNCCAVTLHHPPKGATDIHNWRGSGMAAGDLDNIFCFRNLGDDHICMDQADGKAKHRTARFDQIIWQTEVAVVGDWLNSLGKAETSVRVTLVEEYKVESTARICRAIRALHEISSKCSNRAIARLAGVPEGSMHKMLESIEPKTDYLATRTRRLSP